MKRNRFSEMVPPTTEEFHMSVVDALRRLPVQQRRRTPGAVRIAACIAAVLAVGAALAFALRTRPSPEDRVASPGGEMLSTPAPEDGTGENLHLEIGDWRADASGVGLDWSIGGKSDETLLVCAGAELIPNDERYFTDLMEVYYALLGQPALGNGNGAELKRSEWMSRSDSSEPMPVRLTARIYVYRPKAEFIDDRDQRPESFEGVPKWLISQYEDYVGAQPIDYYGRYDFQTPYGCDRMNSVQSAIGGDYFEDDAAMNLADRMELERILLETLGYAELVKGYEVIIDMSAGSGSGAAEIREIEPQKGWG